MGIFSWLKRKTPRALAEGWLAKDMWHQFSKNPYPPHKRDSKRWEWGWKSRALRANDDKKLDTLRAAYKKICREQ